MRYWINLIEGRNWHADMMADFRSAALTPDEFASKWDAAKRLYLYHGTSLTNLDSIRRQGLVPRGDEPVWLARDPETSDFYQGGRGNGALLRVLKSEITIDIDVGGSTCASLAPIPAHLIDIEQPDGSWLPLV